MAKSKKIDKDMGFRLKNARLDQKLTYDEPVSYTHLDVYKRQELGRNEPIDAVISLICREFGVNENGLRDGTGEMFVHISRDEQIATFIGSIPYLSMYPLHFSF